jgi:hypothetical protein
MRKLIKSLVKKNILELLYEAYKDEYDLNLTEGLIKTTNIDKTLNLLKKSFHKGYHYIKRDNNTFTVNFIHVTKNDLEPFLQTANNLGWFPSYMVVPDKRGTNTEFQGKWDKNRFSEGETYVSFEAKYDEQVVENIPKILYHASPSKNADKILKIGLSPRSRSKKSFHPERVYVSSSLTKIKNIIPLLGKLEGDRNYTVFKINTEEVPGNYFKLYKDPNLPDTGFYTVNNIPPYALSKETEITI